MQGMATHVQVCPPFPTHITSVRNRSLGSVARQASMMPISSTSLPGLPSLAPTRTRYVGGLRSTTPASRVLLPLRPGR
jgi:hypothetical protein